MLPIRKTPRALEDIVGIATYIGQHNPAAALRFLDAVEETFTLLSRSPYIGERVSYSQEELEGFRVRTIIDFRNYIVYYRADEECVFVARVVYGGREQGPIQAELS